MHKRNKKAFFYAIISPVLILVTYAILINIYLSINLIINNRGLLFENIKEATIFAFFIIFVGTIPALIISCISMLFIGLPLYHVFQNYNFTSLKSYLSVGFLLGMICFGVMYLKNFLFLPFAIPSIIIPLSCPLATLVFWLIARPDKYGYDD